METWLVLGIFSYLFYAISTSIDKNMMNKKYEILSTSTFKMLLDGAFLLVIGFLFFHLNFNYKTVYWTAVLGALYAAAGIFYYKILTRRDVGESLPYLNSLQILFIFIFSLMFFGEQARPANYFGVVLILIGVYAILTKKFRLPKFDVAFVFVIANVLINVVYYLLVKKVLFDVKPIDLSVSMYFFCTLSLVLYQMIFRKHKNLITTPKSNIFRIFAAAFAGAMGTLVLFYALSMGEASKIYPMAGLQVVFVFIFASLFLKEKFSLQRLLGTLIVFAGIFFVSL